MASRLLSVVVVLAIANRATAFEVVAVIKKVDVEKRVATVTANGREHTPDIAKDAKILDEKGNALADGLSAKELKEGATVTLIVEPVDRRPTIVSLRLGGKVEPPRRPNEPASVGRQSVGKPSVGFKPLTEMTADDRYKGEDGGLYGGGQNDPPGPLLAAAKSESAKIRPLDQQGRPAEDGRIGLISISMSNATQEFSRFKQLADADDLKSTRVAVVDCAQGGQTMARWADPSANCWTEALHRLQNARVSPEQVQVAWVKLANAGPSGELKDHGRQLERDSRLVLTNLKRRFPNLRVAYLGSRIYGGYADGRLNPEPYAYEGAFAVRWLIHSQMKSTPELNFDDTIGEVKSPLLLWGPYFWGDGTTPRKADSLVWERSDFVGDGTHPSDSGRQKVAEQLLKFFQTDPQAKQWYLGR